MGDHYIPRYYLSGFTSPKDDLLSVYEKNGPLQFRSQVSNVGHETNYYSPEVEEYLANEIEEPANQVLKNIRYRYKIDAMEKQKLSKYMAVMLIRVPQSKHRMNQMAPSVAAKLQKEYDETLLDLIDENPDEKDRYVKRREEIRSNIEKYAKKPPKSFWLELIRPERIPAVVEAFQKMTWRFLIWDDFPVFMTCDNPVFFFDWMGIGRPESEVTFPISSNIVLWLNWRDDLKEGYFKTRSQVFKEVNRRTASNATRFVYHARTEDWIPRFIKKKHVFQRLV